MIELLLFMIFMTLVLYFTTRLVNAVINAIFRVIVAFVMLPRYLGVGLWRLARLAHRFQLWCESRYIAAERRARGV